MGRGISNLGEIDGKRLHNRKGLHYVAYIMWYNNCGIIQHFHFKDSNTKYLDTSQLEQLNQENGMKSFSFSLILSQYCAPQGSKGTNHTPTKPSLSYKWNTKKRLEWNLISERRMGSKPKIGVFAPKTCTN